MADEILVAGIVRTLAEGAYPDDPALVEQAVCNAVEAHLSGASVSEACRVGQLFIARHHPAGDVPSAAQRADQAA